MGATVDFADLDPDMQALLRSKGIKPKQQRTEFFTAEEVRKNAIRALATLAHLTRAERGRVIRQMTKLNKL